MDQGKEKVVLKWEWTAGLRPNRIPKIILVSTVKRTEKWIEHSGINPNKEKKTPEKPSLFQVSVGKNKYRYVQKQKYFFFFFTFHKELTS